MPANVAVPKMAKGLATSAFAFAVPGEEALETRENAKRLTADAANVVGIGMARN